jgi:hypothetical protein
MLCWRQICKENPNLFLSFNAIYKISAPSKVRLVSAVSCIVFKIKLTQMFIQNGKQLNIDAK